jgi:CheY-like chemotaxis protein
VTLRTVAEELLPIPLSITGDEAGHPSVTILLVEDDEDSAAAIAEFLELHGYVVKTAADRARSGGSVRSRRRAGQRHLPARRHRLRRHSRRRQHGPVSAIALSGFGAPEAVRRSLEAGFARHIVKPVLPSELLTRDCRGRGSPAEAQSSRRGGLAQR